MSHERRNRLDRARRAGIEDINGRLPPDLRPPPRPQVTKEQLRAEAEAAFKTWSGATQVSSACLPAR